MPEQRRDPVQNAGPPDTHHAQMPVHVVEARDQLAKAREEIRLAHSRGLTATQVCARLTAAADAAVTRLWVAAADAMSPQDAARLAEGCVLVAHGGYGRRRLAPQSDIDLMILYSGPARTQAEQLSRRLTSELFDVGLEVGHSLRSIDDALQMSRTDPVIGTSLIESRHLIGSQPVFERFWQAFVTATQRRGAAACLEFVEARREERNRYGESVFLLEPNLKRSHGGLRDVHLLRWLWFVQKGQSDPDRLLALGVISKFDHHRLTAAQDFLLRTRNTLQFGSPKAGDALLRHEQLRLAEEMGYRGAEGIKPVEQFMRDYFHHASFVWFLASRLTELTTRRRTVASTIEPILTRSVEEDYRLGFSEISATDKGKVKLARSVDEIFHLLELARDHNKRISQDTWYAVYRSAPELPDGLAPAAAERFLTLLAEREGLPRLLRRAHDLTVLERVLPVFREIRCLLQFNQYHKFTVDEHTLRTVEHAARFAERDDPLGKACRAIEDPALLHLALLLHDVGKAREGDHSLVGEQMAIEMAQRLELSEQRTRRLALLVRQHLTMAHLAFRRDTSDPAVLRDFADLVGDPETLGMLFVLTCADMAGVGPGVLNDWKIGVLADLYQRTLDRLEDPTPHTDQRRNATRVAVWQLLTSLERDRTDLKELFTALPETFLTSRSPKAIAGALRRLARVASGDTPAPDSIALPGIDAWGGYQADGKTLEVVAAIRNGAGRGCFSSIAGALSSKGLRILTAETSLLTGGVLLLRYTAEDPQGAANAAEANRRIRSIATVSVHSIDSDKPPTLPRVWGADKARESAQLSAKPSEVRINTDLSDENTIIEVFTVDRVGLLYELARSLHELGLVIRFAKIATSLDRVVDVFYVSGRDGEKPTDEAMLGKVSRRLMDVIEE